MFTSYLTTWLREPCEWIEYHSEERKDQWRGCKQSLEQLRDTGLQPRQGEVRINKVLSAWWQTHTECFTQDRNVNMRNWQGEAEPHPKRSRQAGPGVLQGVQNLIAELVAKGYNIVLHRQVLKKIESQGHAQGGWLRCIRNRR